jgi:hypothetical protein
VGAGVGGGRIDGAVRLLGPATLRPRRFAVLRRCGRPPCPYAGVRTDRAHRASLRTGQYVNVLAFATCGSPWASHGEVIGPGVAARRARAPVRGHVGEAVTTLPAAVEETVCEQARTVQQIAGRSGVEASTG